VGRYKSVKHCRKVYSKLILFQDLSIPRSFNQPTLCQSKKTNEVWWIDDCKKAVEEKQLLSFMLRDASRGK